jgi:16S rRNA (guanine527-N7)-methyltransferase
MQQPGLENWHGKMRQSAMTHDFLTVLVEKLGVAYPLSAIQLQQLEKHFLLLDKWNRRMNLTSIRDLGQIVQRHYCESVALAFSLPLEKLSVIDAGSGAGFPGIPLAVVRPECFIYLVESDGRKAVFLQECAIGLPNVRVVRARLEDVTQECDWLVSRAVAWEPMRPSVERLARHVGLMTSHDGLQAIMQTPGFAWHKPISLPWGHQRVLLFGDIHGSVSRGTSV